MDVERTQGLQQSTMLDNEELTDSSVPDAIAQTESASQATAAVSSSTTRTASHKENEECQWEHGTDSECIPNYENDNDIDQFCNESRSEIKTEESPSHSQAVPEASSCTDDRNESSPLESLDLMSPNKDGVTGAEKSGDTGDETAVESAAVTNENQTEAPISLSSEDRDEIANEFESTSNDAASLNHKQNISSSMEMNNSFSNGGGDDFEAIELMETSKNNTTEEKLDILSPEERLPEEAATLSHPSPPTTTTATPTPTNNKLRKKLRHPLLTPLTKLPWDRLTGAAGSCDLFFNCKYSLRQVEDEVREEKKTIQYDVLEEDCNDCDVDVQELGLHCCSMLEDSEDEGDAEEVPKKQQVDEEERGNLLVEEEQKRKSWKGSSPTLDMMLYKTFLEE